MEGRIKRKESPSLGIPIIGKIKVGKKNEKGFPESLDYFRCESKYDKYFTDAYGTNPNKIQICFFSDSFKDSCNERYECRDKDGRLSGKGDGENWYVWNDKDKDYLLTSDKNIIKACGKWEMILSINFIIPKISGVFGLFSFSTKGKASSMNNIRDSFDAVLEQAGTVINIPFDLVVDKVISQKPGSKFKFPVVNLIPNLSSENLEVLKGYLNQGNSIKELGLMNSDKMTKLLGE